MSNREGIKQLICPACHRRTSRKWNPDRAPHGYGWCWDCVPAVALVLYDSPREEARLARIRALVRVADV